jgi:formiminotetrahydrofolate cyclodeaminase
MIEDLSMRNFLNELAGKASTPGGGSAAAVIGAMGAALASMVVNFTIGRKGYEEVQAEMQVLLESSEDLRARLMGMIRADVEAFNAVMGAYGMPKETDDEKARRTAAIQSSLKAATDVPLECAGLCAEVIRLTAPVAEKGNRNVISDAGVAVLAAEAALRSAALNVYVNIGAIQDAEFAADRRRRIEELLAGTEKMTEEVYALVRSRL